MHYSDHARTRMEQRGINEEMLIYVMTYGTKKSANNVQSVLLGKKHTQRLKAMIEKLHVQLTEKQRLLKELRNQKKMMRNSNF